MIDTELILNDERRHLCSFRTNWYHSEPSDIPYSPNQFLALDFFFAVSNSQTTINQIVMLNMERNLPVALLSILLLSWRVPGGQVPTQYILTILHPSLNTQSCNRGLLGVQDFCSWAVWAAGPVQKKKLGADYEQLFSAVFSCFRGQIFFNFFLKTL